MTTYSLQTYKLLISIFFASMLIACTTSSTEPTEPTLTNAEDILNAAQSARGEKRIDLLLQACGQFLQRNDTKQCDTILNELSTTPLNTPQLANYSLYRSTLHLKRNEALKALNVLNSPHLEKISGNLAAEQQAALLEQKAIANDQLGQAMNSAQLRLFIHSMLPATKQGANAEALWNSLMKVDRQELENSRKNSQNNPNLQGWIELALIGKDSQSDIDTTLSNLDKWKQRWPQHTANTHFPKDLTQLREFSSKRPQQLALLVPLTGKLANYGLAISQGFMAAHYQASTTGDSQPRIRIYDTNNGNIIQIYQQAIKDGAQLVIGPLDKTQTTELLQSPLTVPVLALNQSDSGALANNAFQFGLSPDDEVRAVVKRAIAEQRLNTLILAPQGDGMERIVDLFREEWRKNGGAIINEARYDSNIQSYASTISRALNIQQSQQRAKQVSDIIGDDINFTPRHRQDIDMIFVVAKPSQARSIMPMLTYQYGGDIPTYATSSVFSGATNPRLDQDINKLQFPELPWILNDSPLKQSVSKSDTESRQLPRMYALGIDAYQLHSRLELMSAIPSTTFYGTTGTLTLNSKKHIERELPMAIISDGKPTKALFKTH